MQWCAYYGDVSAIKFLLLRGAKLALLGHNIDLNAAVYHGHWQLTQFLLESGADPNDADAETGETPLHSAIVKPNLLSTHRVVALLLAHGADPNSRTKNGVITGAFMRDCKTKGETPVASRSSIRQRGDHSAFARRGSGDRCEGCEWRFSTWMGKLVWPA